MKNKLRDRLEFTSGVLLLLVTLHKATCTLNNKTFPLISPVFALICMFCVFDVIKRSKDDAKPPKLQRFLLSALIIYSLIEILLLVCR